MPAGLDAVWVEGAGVIRAELAGWVGASLHVRADLDVQIVRLLERDGDEPAMREHRAQWSAEELPFMAREQP